MESYEFCLAPALDLLEEKKAMWYYYMHLEIPIEMMKMELEFLQMFLWGLGYYEEFDFNDRHLCFAIFTLRVKLSQIAEEFAADCESGNGLWHQLDLEAVMYGWEEKIDKQLIRPQAKDVCILLLGGDYKCSSCPGRRKKFCKYVEDTTSFMDLILQNLKALLNSNLIAPVMKQQVALLQGGLEDFSMFVGPPNRLFDLIPQTRTWFNRISCLTYLYWIDGSNEAFASAMETMLSAVLLENTRPCTTSGVISPFFQPVRIHQLLVGHVDFLLEDLIIPMDDGIGILHEGLIFLLSFIMDPSGDDSEDREMIWSQIYAIINKFPSLIYSIVHFRETDAGNLKANFSKFFLDTHTVKEKVRNYYFTTPYPSQVRFPNTNAFGFLDILIRNMKILLQGEVNSIPFFLHQYCELLLTELVSLRPLLKNIMELFNNDEHVEIEDLWKESINMVYHADYIIKLCCLKNISAWYGIIALPDAIKHISNIKIEMNKQFGVDKMYMEKKHDHRDWIEGAEALRPRRTTSEMDRDPMGFIEDQKVIIDELVRGQKSLTIISISGSGGQGKTTLAKRIYNDFNIQCCFQKCLWCYVSNDCPVKELLAQILSFDGAIELGLQDLVERVWKSLKGRRYLIVMDDIWDIDTWGKLEASFPDDKNGSRILFTSRNHDLISQVKSNWISHPLQLFSEEESWELMKKRVFCSDHCDEEFVEIGKIIASYCKGLPLAIVLTAAVLGRTKQNLDSWNKVAENLKAHLAQEGCGKVIELSYEYLPDYLKPCFLYFGAFGRGENVIAKKLKLLWIGEGFIIQDRETEVSEEYLATEYLNKLVSQALVIVTERRRCNVHDLLYDLCLEKCKEDNFMNWLEDSHVDRCCYVNHLRLRIDHCPTDPFIMSSPIFINRKLPTNSVTPF